MYLEFNTKFVRAQDVVKIGTMLVMRTPPLDEDYWLFRVKLGRKGQAIVGFPKFRTIGIGFAKEEADWNTNVPYTCATEEIYQHIRCNAGNLGGIRQRHVVAAIQLVQQAAAQFMAAKKGAN
jgi:hypothetical protein